MDGDLVRTIRSGVFGTHMLPWPGLTDPEVGDLVAYVEHFSSRFETEPRGIPMVVPPEPIATPEGLEQGRQLFEQACASCHGADGRGSGPAARSPGLLDEQGNRIWPGDLTGRLKSSQNSQDVYRVLVTGLDGTPMPSYAESLSPEQTWDLVHWVASLSVRAPR